MPRTRNDEANRKRQDEFLKAFAEIGVIKPAAESIGMSATPHYQWLVNYPDYAERFEALRRQCEANGTARAHRKPTGRAAGFRVTEGIYAESRAERKGPFLAAMQEGMTVREAAKVIHASFASVYKWMRDDEVFAAQVREAREANDMLIRQRANDARREAMARVWEDPARRAQMSKAKKAMWADPDRRAKHSDRMLKQWKALDTDARTERLMNMRKSIKGGVTISSLEAKVMEALNDAQVPYMVHYVIGKFVADFYLPSDNLVVEADGNHVHQNPAQDAVRDAALEALGFTVLHLAEDDIEAGDFSKLAEALA